MKTLKMALLTVLVLGLLAPAAPALAKGFFQEWGITGYYNNDIDIDEADLMGAGTTLFVEGNLLAGKTARLDLRLEGQVGRFWDYDNGWEFAVVPGLRLLFPLGKVQPYLEGGIGPSYNTLNIQELGMGFNFLSYGGVGLRFLLSGSTSLEIGYRLRHISNAGLDERNHGVTSNQVQVGLAFAF